MAERLDPHLRIVEEIAAAAQGTHDLDELLRRLCASVARGFAFERVAISRYRPEADELVYVAAYGIEDEVLAARPRSLDAYPIVRRAFASGEVVFVEAAGADDLAGEVAAPLGITSALAVPLFSAGCCLGHLGGDRAGRPFSLDASSRRMLTTVAVVAATLLEKALVVDELRRLDAAKDQFVALAAHGLRAPAAVVVGAAETLDARAERLSDEQRRRLLELVHGGGRRLTALVHQFLDLSRLDAAAITLRAERLPLRARVERVVDAVAGERRHEVEVAIPPGLEAVADPAAFDRILANLLVNALRHGGAPIVVSAAAGEVMVVVVEDRGGGVSEELAPRLFDRFARGDETSPRAGAGLGLAIARAYARAQGGDLVYEPAQPHGALFRLTVPSAPPAAA